MALTQIPSSSGGGAPSGAAGGDLSGTYPDPSVAKVGGTTATTIGKAIVGLTNPGAITFLRANADNTASLLSAADTRTALGLTSLATTTPGANVATFLATPTLANLNAAVSDADVAILGANTFVGAQVIAPTTPGLALTLTSGTVTTSTPLLDITQTWNGAGVQFTALKLNITNTASATTSRLFDLQVGGTNVFAVSSNGGNPAFHSVGGIYQFFANGTCFSTFSTGSTGFGNSGLRISNTVGFGWTSGAANGSEPDTHLIRDSSAGVLAMRASTQAQTFRVYGVADTVQTLTNYVRASLAATSTAVTLAAETAGTGADNVPLNLTTAGTGLVDFTNQSASADAAVVSTHTFRIKVGGTEYKVLLATP